MPILWLVAGLCLLAIPACSMYPALTVEVILGVAFLAAVLIYPPAGLMAMMALFLIQPSPIYQTYGKGILAQSGTAADLVGVVVLFAFIVRSQERRGSWTEVFRGKSGLALLAVGAYFTATILAIFWSPASSDLIVNILRKTIEASVFFVLVLVLLRSPSDVRRAAAVYAGVGFLLAIYVFVTFRSNHGFSVTVTNSYLGQQAFRGGLPTAFNPNEYAVVLSLVPIFTYLAADAFTRRIRFLLTGATVPVVGLALIILASRTALLAIPAAILIAVILSRGYGNRITFGLVLVVAGITLYALASAGDIPWYLQSRFASADTGSLGFRLPLWKVGMQFFLANPIGGIGLGGFETLISTYHVNVQGVISPHSDYVWTLANTGLFGFIPFAVMLATLGWLTIVGSGRNPASIAGYVILILAIFSGTFVHEHWFWVAMSILVAFGLVARRGAEESGAIGRSAASGQSQDPASRAAPLPAQAPLGAAAGARGSPERR